MQVDDYGNTSQLLKEIVDHRKTKEEIKSEDALVSMRNGIKKRLKTTKSWDFKVQWTDDTESWIPLSDIKESNPVEAAEYAVSRQIEKEPAFIWWVPTTLKKRDRIISKIKSRMAKKNLKYGITLPSTV
jgi:hypothetical protein